VIKEDLENPNLLFLGTEFGLWVSVDAGASWARFETDFPKVGVFDLTIHPRENDLVIATHGRGIWILDDITPLRALTPEVLASDVALLPTRPNVMWIGGGEQEFPGNEEFTGRNPSEAASIVYYQRRRHIFGDLKVEVYDAEGKLITTIPGEKLRGINRVDWPMRLPPPKLPPAVSLAPVSGGPVVPEGTYTYKLLKGNDVYEGHVTLVADPRSPHSAEDRQLQQRTALELYAMLERLAYVVDATLDLRDQARARADSIGGGTANRLKQYADRLDEFQKGLVASRAEGYVTGEEKLREHLANLYSSVNEYAGRPTDSEMTRMQVLGGQLGDAERRFGELTVERELRRFDSALRGRGLEPLKLMTREEWEAKKTGR
jgi:diadenosine tetraphosphate (Ap4A) HIT family hydrolase